MNFLQYFHKYLIKKYLFFFCFARKSENHGRKKVLRFCYRDNVEEEKAQTRKNYPKTTFFLIELR
jgi:hypothetical protein